MCVEPCMVPEVGPVACRNCWQCRENRINDLVGRCIAEQQTATATRAVTLTYSDDLNPGNEYKAATLVYKDFQDFMKRLRKAGYNVRYIVAGEYGKKDYRAHWHAVLFFYGKAPECVAPYQMEKHLLRNTPNLSAPKFTTKICEEDRFYWKHWPHGVVWFEKPEYEGFRYVLKYALKDQKLGIQENRLAMSKKPPLGYQYFMERAHNYAEQGLSPQSPEYEFRHSFDRYTGKRRKYWLQGRMREIYVGEYLAAYQEKHGKDYPFSDFVLEMEDKWVREEEREAPFCKDEWAKRLGEREEQAERRMANARKLTDAIKRVAENKGEAPYEIIEAPAGARWIADLIYRDTQGVHKWRVNDEGQLERAVQLLEEWNN